MGTEHIHPTPDELANKIATMQQALDNLAPKPAQPTINIDPDTHKAIAAMQHAFTTINLGDTQ